MTTFDDRENAFESHFAFEEELEFKAKARRDRLVAVWAGELMGLKDGALEDYVLSVMRADLQDPNGDEVYQKVLVDLAHKGVHVSPHEVRAQIDQLMAKAREQVGADQHADRD
jgi:hypothetical protein